MAEVKQCQPLPNKNHHILQTDSLEEICLHDSRWKNSYLENVKFPGNLGLQQTPGVGTFLQSRESLKDGPGLTAEFCCT